jgi:hypothetical protein
MARTTIVHFQNDCSTAGCSRKLSFITEGQQGLLCGAGRSQLRTDAATAGWRRSNRSTKPPSKKARQRGR